VAAVPPRLCEPGDDATTIDIVTSGTGNRQRVHSGFAIRPK
jgi:hypothetical protein